MARLIYVTNVSLDGFIEDADGDINFSDPNDEVFAFITDLITPFSTFLYGRRLYESMSVWETDPSLAAMSDLYAAFAAAWQDADKVVYSTTLDAVPTARTRVERTFDADAVQAIKNAATGDIMVGGAEFFGHLVDAGLVDEIHLFVLPVLLRAGKPAVPPGAHVKLALLEERRFGSSLYLRYGVGSS